MWAARFWAPVYFAPRYWSETGAAPLPFNPAWASGSNAVLGAGQP